MLPFLSLVAVLLQGSSAAPTKRLSPVPVISENFPDPSLISTNNTWYAFATNSGQYNVQVAQSSDFITWEYLNQDALPDLPAWVDASAPNVWAPDVSERVRYSKAFHFMADSGRMTVPISYTSLLLLRSFRATTASAMRRPIL